MKILSTLCLLLMVIFVQAQNPPIFTGGVQQTLTICQNAPTTSINNQLSISDADTGNILTWAIVSAPQQGTLQGFPGIRASNGGVVTPSGFAYTPSGVYSGVDSFIISLNDGTTTIKTTIKVTLNPVGTINPIAGKTALCLGETTTLTNATNNGVWVSSLPSVANISSLGIVTTHATGTTLITYSISNSFGCTNSASALLLVSGYPVVDSIIGDTSLCTSLSTQFTCPTKGGIWSSSSTAIASINSTGKVTGLSGSLFGNTATIFYAVTNAGGCTKTVSKNITVYSSNSLNNNSITTGGLCKGQTLQINNQSAIYGATTTSWSSTNPAIASVDNFGLVSGISSGVDTIKYTAVTSRGCISVASSIITVSVAPTVASINGLNTVCIGSNIQLSDSTAAGVWSSSSTAVASINNAGLVTGLAQGTTTIKYTVTNASGCSSFSSFNISTDTLPMVNNIVGSNTLCTGNTATFTNATSGGFWSSNNPAIFSITNTGIVTAQSAGNAIISYSVTNTKGCTKSATLNMTIAASITVANIVGISKYCTGNNSTLTCATSGGSWSSSNNAIAVITSGGVVTALSEGIDTIKYFVNGGAGCSGYSTFIIKVYQKPVLSSNVSTASAICFGGTDTISNSTSGGVWSTSNPTIISVSSSGILTGLRTGSAIITYTVDNNGCSATTTTSFTVNANPTVTPITGLNSFCIGSGATLSNSTGSGVWSSSNTALAVVSSNGFTTALSAGNVNISYTVKNPSTKCTTTVVYPIVISPTLYVAPIIGVDSVCLGNNFSKLFTNVTTGGTWTSSNSSTATVTTTGLVFGVSAGSVDLIYTVTNGTGCTTSVSKTINIVGLPSINPVTGPNTVCQGSTINLTCSPPGGKWTKAYAYSSVDSLTGAVTGIIGAHIDVISYRIFNSLGCYASSDYNVTISNSNFLTTTIGGLTSVARCYKQVTQLTNATPGGTWASSDPSIASITSSGLLSINFNGGGTVFLVYSVPSTVSGQCPSVASTNFVAKPLPNVTPIVGGPDTICQNSLGFVDNATTGGSWSVTNPALAYLSSGFGGSFITYLPGVDTIVYKVTSTSTGCSNTALFPIVIKANTTLDTISGNTNLCLGSKGKLICNPFGGVWSLNDTSIAKIDSLGFVTPLKIGTAVVTYQFTNSNGCTKAVTKNIYVNSIPLIAPITGSSIACVNSNRQLTSLTNGGVWKSKSIGIATIQNNGIVRGVASGVDTITYTVTNTYGCSDSVQKVITIYPAPTVDSIVGKSYFCYKDSIYFTNATPGGIWTSEIFGAPSQDILIDSFTGLIKAGTLFNKSSYINYTVKSSVGCSNTATKSVKVVYPSKNVVTIFCQNTPPYSCIGGYAIVSSLGNQISGGVWSSSDTTVVKILSGPIFEEVAAGTANITYSITDSNGCVSSSTTTAIVNPLPNVNPIIGTNNICVNKSTNFINTVSGGVWKVSNNSIGKINSSGLFNGLKSGNTDIKYIVTGTNGCMDSAILPIIVNPRPSVISSSNSPISLNQTIQLNGLSNDTINSWNWSGPNSFTSNSQNPTIVNANIAMIGTYKLFGISNYGCSSDTTSTYVFVGDNYYITGNVHNPLNKPVKGATIKLSGLTNSLNTTDSSGNYSFNSLLNGNFIVKPIIKNDVSKSNGINTTDVLLVQRHILNTTKITNPYKLIAADVTGDKIINTTDVLRIKRLILGSDTTFTKTIGTVKTDRLWEFVDSAYVFPDTTNPFPFKDSISFTNLTSNKINQTFIGVKLGDVNDSWNPAIARGSIIDNVELIIDNADLKVNKQLSTVNYQLPIKVKNFKDLVAMQYTLHFNNNDYEFVGIENNKLGIDFNDKQANKNGNISFLWTDKTATEKTLDDGSELFTLVLKQKGIGNLELGISDAITDIAAWDKDFNQHSIILTQQQKLQTPNTEQWVVSPNPTSGDVKVNIICKTNKTILFKLSDAQGRTIFQQSCEAVKGNNTFNINLKKNKALPIGIYFLKATGIEGEDVKKIVVE